MLSGLMPQPPYPWLQGAWQNFAGLVVHNRVPHALLLVGQEGIGCDDLAKAMAQLLLCQTPLDGRSCGRCRSCSLAQADSHPDLLVLRPEEKSQVIKIDQVRSMVDFIAKTAQQGGRKLVIIHPAEAMNPAAANALLKSLEEPSGESVFILVSEKAAFLMPTIRSRCARTEIHVPSEQQAIEWLERNRVDKPGVLLREAGGRPLQVIEWIEQDVWGQRAELERDVVKLLTSHYGFLECSKSALGYGAQWVVEQLLGWVMAAVPEVLMNPSLEELSADDGSLVECLKRCPADRLLKLYDSLISKKRLLLSSANPNPQLLLDEVMMELKELTRFTS